MTDMERNPERKGAPDPIEKRPREKPSEKVVRGLGKAAIKGNNSGK
ncbi:hypothetical protein [Streptomyces sp. SID13031]|nr:hypothetical protein [Streptomyces sp. SID13031]NEA32807.1 hypothetical protein [Streptomyces sp. SID13031]